MRNIRLLEILACPRCKGAVAFAPDDAGVICTRCQVTYPLENGIPVMLAERGAALGQGGQFPGRK